MPTNRLRSQEAPSVTGYLAAETISGHRLVIIEPNGTVNYASCLEPTHPGRLLGLTLNAAIKGDRVSVQRAGQIIEPSWSWQTSKPLWLGLDGQLSQNRPSRGFICVVGVAISPQSILMANIQAVHITHTLNG